MCEQGVGFYWVWLRNKFVLLPSRCHAPEARHQRESAVRRQHQKTLLQHLCPPDAPATAVQRSAPVSSLGAAAIFTSWFFRSSHEAQADNATSSTPSTGPACPGLLTMAGDGCSLYNKTNSLLDELAAFWEQEFVHKLRETNAWALGRAIVCCHHSSSCRGSWFLLIHFVLRCL